MDLLEEAIEENYDEFANFIVNFPHRISSFDNFDLPIDINVKQLREYGFWVVSYVHDDTSYALLAVGQLFDFSKYRLVLPEDDIVTVPLKTLSQIQRLQPITSYGNGSQWFKRRSINVSQKESVQYNWNVRNTKKRMQLEDEVLSKSKRIKLP